MTDKFNLVTFNNYYKFTKIYLKILTFFKINLFFKKSSLYINK